MLPNANGAAATLLGMMSAGRVPAMINFHRGRRQHPGRLHRRRNADDRDLARLCREG